MDSHPAQQKEIVPISEEMKFFLGVLNMNSVDFRIQMMERDKYFQPHPDKKKGHTREGVFITMMKEIMKRDAEQRCRIEELQREVATLQGKLESAAHPQKNCPVVSIQAPPPRDPIDLTPVYNGEHTLSRDISSSSKECPIPSKPEIPRNPLPKRKDEETPTRNDRPDTSNDEEIARSLQDDNIREEFAITPTPVNPRQIAKKSIPATPLKRASPPVSPSHTALVYAGGSHPADWTTSDSDLALRRKIIEISPDKYSFSTLQFTRDRLMQILRSFGGKMVSK